MARISLSLDDEVLSQIDQVRGTASRSHFIKESINLLLAERFRKAVKVGEGIKAIEAGNVYTEEEVKDSVRALGIQVD